MIEFTVQGVPAPQGSKTPYGAEASPRHKSWRQAVATAALVARRGSMPFPDGPVQVSLTFVFARPKTHAKLDDPPRWKTSTPDIDKLVRSVCDSLTGVIYLDDRQVAWVSAKKAWHDTSGVSIQVSALSA